VRVEVIEVKTVYDGFVRLDEATVRYERFDGAMSEPVTRLCMERGDSVAAVVVDSGTDQVLLTRQFRYPTYRRDDGWILELPAGSADSDEPPLEGMKRELVEELGLSVARLEHISTFFTSPGASSERIWLYYAEVDESDRVGPGGGLDSENEDIQTYRLPVHAVPSAIEDGSIRDAKTLIGLQWLIDKRRTAAANGC
jgi:ADP-ribose pyrophosphatase